MAFDPTKPAASSALSSAEVRANFAALHASLMGVNLIADPGHYIWPQETSNGASGQTNPPAHWALSGTGATVQRCGTGLTDTTDYESGGWACELTYGSATARFYQNLLDAIPDALIGHSIAFGLAVKCSTGSAARPFVYDSATGYTYSDAYHTGGGSWEWLEVVHEIGNGSTLLAGVELASSSCHVQGATALLGDIVATHPVPAPVVVGTYGVSVAGEPASAQYGTQTILPGRPFLFTGLGLSVDTAPSGGTCVVNVRRYTSSWVDMLASNLTLSDGHSQVSSSGVDSVYRYRCIDQAWGASAASLADEAMRAYVVTNAGAAEDLLFHIRGIQFARPQDSLTIFNDPTKDGS